METRRQYQISCIPDIIDNRVPYRTVTLPVMWGIWERGLIKETATSLDFMIKGGGNQGGGAMVGTLLEGVNLCTIEKKWEINIDQAWSGSEGRIEYQFKEERWSLIDSKSAFWYCQVILLLDDDSLVDEDKVMVVKIELWSEAPIGQDTEIEVTKVGGVRTKSKIAGIPEWLCAVRRRFFRV